MISPSLGADLAEPVAAIYRDAELRILERIAAALATGLGAPDWEVQQLARLQVLRESVLAELAVVNPIAAEAIQEAMASAYGSGVLSAFADAGQHVEHLEPLADQRAAAVVTLAAETVRGVAGAQGAILRGVDDLYRAVVAQVSSQVTAGALGRQEAVQSALRQFARAGIATIQTRRGQMNLADYTQMAVRTATSRTALAGHLDAMDRVGLDLVVIHPGPRACKICDRWARAVLTRGRVTGVQRLESVTTGREVSVRVDATLADARAAGWGHPNCRCALQTYLPGLTKREVIERPRWDQEGYEAQQRQRAIERQIRGWKIQQATAVTPEAKAETGARVKAWQGAMRDLLDEHPYLKRQGSREQIGG